MSVRCNYFILQLLTSLKVQHLHLLTSQDQYPNLQARLTSSPPQVLAIGLLRHREKVAILTSLHESKVTKCSFLRADASAGVCHQIEESDVDTVYNYLQDTGDWVVLCKRLGLPQGAINNIQSSTSDKLYGCLGQLSKLGPPHSCWEKVAAVVCGPPFHNRRLGSDIVRDKNLVMPSECKPR